jgi:hypothetical protein
VLYSYYDRYTTTVVATTDNVIEKWNATMKRNVLTKLEAGPRKEEGT